MANDAPLADILIVDDAPMNLDVLAKMLEEQGYRARPVPSGFLALQAARAQPPDLILLDINMPEMNGYEVCEHLKADERLKGIPVIVISALDNTEDKVRAFRVGTVDYITKPFQFDEVRARVETHLRIHHLQKELEQQYATVKKLEGLKDNLTHMIVHDMASPILSIGMALDLALNGKPNDDRENRETLSRARDASRALVEMVNSLLDITKIESAQMPLRLTAVGLRCLAEEAIRVMELMAEAKHIRITVTGPEVSLHADRDLVRRVFINLIGNAIKFTPDAGAITVTVSASGGQARAEVRDTGAGIPEAYHERIFEKFGQLEAAQQGYRHSVGLGLTFSKLVVVAHGGCIGVRSRVGEGSTFWFSLPLAGVGSGHSNPAEHIAPPPADPYEVSR